MSARKTLYLLRRPIVDSTQSLLPLTSAGGSGGNVSLVLLEEAVRSAPSFPGPVYVLRSSSNDCPKPSDEKIISYPELVALIAEHDTSIVL